MKIVAECYSGKTDKDYQLVNPDKADIEADFNTVVARLDEKDEKLDNKEVPCEFAYKDRMVRSTEVVYCYQEGKKVGFAYIMTNHRYGPVPIVASFVMNHDCDPVSLYLMFSYMSTKYRKLWLYPHGSVVTDLKSAVTKESLIRFHQKVKPYLVVDYNDIVKGDNPSYTRIEKYFQLKIKSNGLSDKCEAN